MSQWFVGLVASGVVLSVAPALAQNRPDGAALQSVIASQLDAIGHDDAVTAESFAAPGIKQKFPDPTQFLAMVKQSYAPLVHPKSTHFEPSADAGLGPMETVTIVDSSGVVWTAIYTFAEVDGQWRISGCALLKAPDTSA